MYCIEVKAKYDTYHYINVDSLTEPDFQRAINQVFNIPQRISTGLVKREFIVKDGILSIRKTSDWHFGFSIYDKPSETLPEILEDLARPEKVDRILAYLDGIYAKTTDLHKINELGKVISDVKSLHKS